MPQVFRLPFDTRSRHLLKTFPRLISRRTRRNAKLACHGDGNLAQRKQSRATLMEFRFTCWNPVIYLTHRCFCEEYFACVRNSFPTHCWKCRHFLLTQTLASMTRSSFKHFHSYQYYWHARSSFKHLHWNFRVAKCISQIKSESFIQVKPIIVLDGSKYVRPDRKVTRCRVFSFGQQLSSKNSSSDSLVCSLSVVGIWPGTVDFCNGAKQTTVWNGIVRFDHKRILCRR